MKVDDKFSSFEELIDALEDHKQVTCTQYFMRDCRTLASAAKRTPERIRNANMDLKYYCIKFCCIHGGKKIEEKTTIAKRISFSFQEGCMANIHIAMSEDRQFLVVKSVNNEHNHDLNTRWDEALIVEVSRHPNLYESSCLDQEEKTNVNDSWEQIGAILDIEVSTCIERWKNIRRQYEKVKECVECGLSISKTQWRLFNLLTFLENKDYQPSVHSTKKRRRSRKSLLHLRGSVLALPAEQRTRPVVLTSPPTEQEFQPSQTERSTDADEHYLLSLVPAFRRLSKRAKSKLRINIETMVYNAEYGSD